MSDLAARRQREARAEALEARVRTLEQALELKTAMLREVDHRTRNNLQLICSLMLLQSRRLQDEAARRAVRTTLERVNAVAAVQRHLLQGEDPRRLDVANIVRDLASDLAAATGRSEIAVRLELEPVALPSASAAPFSLVVNELLGNALKHAFPGERAGLVSIGLRGTAGGAVLSVVDDGVGMSGHTPGLGLTIVELLCQQLRAKLAIAPGPPGVQATVRLADEPPG
jgi:two-component sensor histidine kinase